MVDAADSKSVGFAVVGVRVSPGAPNVRQVVEQKSVKFQNGATPNI